ncbi:SEFIR domain-containing protein [Acetobacterium wieringae]|uniref:SEFIR domain-containing protein n=1 Tax=Acetobacterium wieringae TaxID=52694 RepID=UPI0020333702|nr:SEFIR domain-containing protein [Acetobacterium wieringae]URN83900.1 TIR domain-containing protein [Acetobacterium wieringae]
MENQYSPKVFISYSQDSISFADKVLEFSNKLRSDGIDTILDQYEESPPEGWPRWMEKSIDIADYVLVVGSIGYQNKIAGTVEAGIGRGAKWEGHIIYQKLYMADSINKKYIPVIFSRADIDYIPTPIQGSTYYDVSTQKGFDDLYWRLRGIKTKQKPPLGKLRPLPEKERKTLFITSMIDLETWDKAVWRGAGFIVNTDLPILLLLFIHEEYAVKIFKDWISDVGVDDKSDDIRIALIEGDIPNEEAGYYIVIGSNLKTAAKRAERQGVPMDEMLLLNFTRLIRANPTDNFAFFNIFKQKYQKFGEYYLIPAIIDESSNKIKPLMQYKIHKKELFYRHVDEINEYDEDSIILEKNKPAKPYQIEL